MPKQIDTIYVGWEFSSEEAPHAQTFTDLQKKHIQTKLAEYVQEKTLMGVAEFEDVQVYLRRQEYLRGAMEGLMYLLAYSSAVEDATSNLAKEALAASRNQQES